MLSTISKGGITTRFNPRPREGASRDARRVEVVHHVSIRAPVRGRPARARLFAATGQVSIRAPVRGRPCASSAVSSRLPVSIRAPVRGRQTAGTEHVVFMEFQSAPP